MVTSCVLELGRQVERSYRQRPCHAECGRKTVRVSSRDGRRHISSLAIIVWLLSYYSKLVRYLVQWDLRSLETLRPEVAPSLRSGRYSLRPSGL